MKRKNYKALIIEDHPLISEAYKSAFNKISTQDPTISFKISVAHDCDTAYKMINDFSENNITLDIVFLDVRLPPSKNNDLLSGEDLGLMINLLLPEAKIIVSTTFNDNYRIQSIFKSINPDGFLIKNDISPNELMTTINTVMDDPPYYSKTVIKIIRREISNEFVLDYIDRKILYELSLGTRMKDLPTVLPLSIAGIEKRKRHLKNIFNIKTVDDKELILKAKEKGFI